MISKELAQSLPKLNLLIPLNVLPPGWGGEGGGEFTFRVWGRCDESPNPSRDPQSAPLRQHDSVCPLRG